MTVQINTAVAGGGGSGNALTVTGALGAGNVLTATANPGWIISGYQWYRDGVAISGETNQTYTQTVTDFNKTISVRVSSLGYQSTAGIVPVGPIPSTRAIATNTSFPNNYNTTYKQMMTRRRHVIRSRITSIKARLVNTYIDTATWTELGSGASTTFVITIEKNGVNLGNLQVSGSSSIVVPDLGQVDTDALTVDLFPGDVIYTREYRTNPNGILYEGNAVSGTRPQYNDTANGEACYAAASGIVDQTAGTGALTGGTNVTSAMGGPFALLGTSTNAAICILGDSEEVGIGETFSALGNRGVYARSLAPNFATVKVAQGGDAAVKFVASNTKRRAAMAGIFTYIVCDYGVNDINANSQTPAQVVANLQTIAGYFTGIPFDWRTMTPYSSSTDSFATTANQTPQSTAGTLNSLNNLMRAVPAGIRRVWETSDVVSNGRDSNIWKADGNVANRRTADGLHLTGIAGDDIVSSGLFVTSAFPAS